MVSANSRYIEEQQEQQQVGDENSDNLKSKYKEKCNMQQQLSVSTSCDFTRDT